MFIYVLQGLDLAKVQIGQRTILLRPSLCGNGAGAGKGGRRFVLLLFLISMLRARGALLYFFPSSPSSEAYQRGVNPGSCMLFTRCAPGSCLTLKSKGKGYLLISADKKMVING